MNDVDKEKVIKHIVKTHQKLQGEFIIIHIRVVYQKWSYLLMKNFYFFFSALLIQERENNTLEEVPDTDGSESVLSSVDDPDDLMFEKRIQEQHKAHLYESRMKLIGKPEFETIVRSFNPHRMKSVHSVLKFWEDNKEHYPDLYPIALIIFSVPGTQVSVERLFSQLKFLLDPLRNRLGSQMVNDIFILKANFKHI